MNQPALEYSDYVAYVDESGDHSLASIDDHYPIFVLCFCVFLKRHYSEQVIPALKMLKFNTFGHDMVILHEQDLRRKTEAFRMMNKEKREVFLSALEQLISGSDFTLFSSIIDKRKLKKENIQDTHVYHLAMQLGLEKLYRFMQSKDQDSRITHIVCEARGRIEDRELELEFLRVCSGHNSMQQSLPFQLILADKKTNSEGLQFADLAARPIGLSTIRPGQFNRAYNILEKKFHRNGEGVVGGYGVSLYPPKSEKPQGSP
jgi:hypothetical protein